MLRDSGRYRRKLTPWEAGQIIIDLYDRMADTQEELDRDGHPELARVVRECIIDLYDRMADNQEELDRDGHPELARVVRECANKMAEALDAHGSHKIGLGRIK